jgi:hypothetical protein
LIIAAGFEETVATEFPETPCAVVGGDEGSAGGGEFGAVAIGGALDGWFPERAVETFGDAAGPGCADEREARGESVEAARAREVVVAMLGVVIVAQFDAVSGADAPRAEAGRERPGDGRFGGEAVAAFAGGVAEALDGPLLDGREQPQPGVVDGRPCCAVAGPARIRRRMRVRPTR